VSRLFQDIAKKIVDCLKNLSQQNASLKTKARRKVRKFIQGKYEKEACTMYYTTGKKLIQAFYYVIDECYVENSVLLKLLRRTLGGTHPSFKIHFHFPRVKKGCCWFLGLKSN